MTVKHAIERPLYTDRYVYICTCNFVFVIFPNCYNSYGQTNPENDTQGQASPEDDTH